MLVVTITGIIIAEIIAMIVVFGFRHWPYPYQVMLDAAVMTAIIFPLLYVLSFKPLLKYIHNQRQSEIILQARLRLIQSAKDKTLDELLQLILDEIEILTDSKIGFFHFLDDDSNTLWLQSWSSNTTQNMCSAEGKGSHYNVDQAGVWADAVRLRKPVIHNNYAALTYRRGMPDGHAEVVREIVVPIMRNGNVKAILGLGNKITDYTAADVDLVATFADFAWDVVESKRSEFALRQSEEKFRTLVDWTYDWELWLDPNGSFVYSSPSCERITGYTTEEMTRNPHLLFQIIHPEDRHNYEIHHSILHDSTAGTEMIEYRIRNRSGEVRHIEHICHPLFDPNSRYLGRRISNRDITERKLAQLQVVENNRKEAELKQTIQTIQTDIARDLHDSLGQNISYLRMNLENLLDKMQDGGMMKQIRNMIKAADESYGLIRTMLVILQNSDSDNPISPFIRYAKQIEGRAPFKISITIQGKPSALQTHQVRHLFYIFREALNNIEKYAGASHVSAEFRWEEHFLNLKITDNGHGFDPSTVDVRSHFGVKFMSERAELLNGNLEIASTPGGGTAIIVQVPCEETETVATT